MTSARASKWKNPDWYCHGILDGTREVERVYENEHALAFLAPPDHCNERYETHVLVITKRHVTTLLDLGMGDESLLAGLLTTVQHAAAALGLDERGFILRANVLPPFQHTGHIHMHLLSGERG